MISIQDRIHKNPSSHIRTLANSQVRSGMTDSMYYIERQIYHKIEMNLTRNFLRPVDMQIRKELS